MTNEPKAGGSLDPEMLAAYLDKRLPPEARATVEAQLARDPDSYELLVELIHANEALKGETPAEGEAAEPADHAEPQGRTGAVVPMVPKPKRTGGWLIAGGVLATAAALALVAWLQPELWQRLRGGDPVDPLMAKLVEAVGEERYIEARLTGGFKYGELRSVTRGADLARENLTLLAAAGQLQRLAQESPTQEHLHAWGIALLLIGDPAGAVKVLTTASSGEPGAADIWSDLGAAYLTRSARLSAPEDVPVAIEHIEKALAIDSTHAVALFNRADALEQLGLRDSAIAAWSAYLEVDPSSAWAEHARSRQAALAVSPQADAELKRAIEALPTRMRPAESDLQSIREHLEDELAGIWLRGLVENGEDRHRYLWELASLLAVRQQDPLLIETLAIVRRDPASIRAAHITRGFACYGQMRGYYQKGDFVRAGQTALECGSFFASADAPFQRWTAIYAARAAGFSGNTGNSLRVARELLHAPSSNAYPVVSAWAAWQAGGIQFISGNYGEAVPLLRRAALGFEQAAEFDNAASVHDALAATYLAIGDRRNTWQHYRSALRLSPQRRFTIQNYATRNGVAVACLRGGLPRTARLVLQANLTFARRLPSTGPAAETQRNLAEASLAIGALDEAAGYFAAAQADASRAPQGPGTTRTTAEFSWTAARLGVAVRDPSSLDLIRTAAAQFRELRLHQRLLSVYSLSSEAARMTGRVEAALAAVDEGMNAVHVQERSLRRPHERASFRQAMSGLFREAARIRVAQGALEASLLAVERFHVSEVGLTEAQLLANFDSLPTDTAAVVFLTEPEAVFRWIVSNQGVVFDPIPLPSERLAFEVKRFRSSLMAGGTPGRGRSELPDLLLGGAGRIPAATKRLVVVPDGLLWGVPFTALPDGDGILADRFEVVMATSVAGYAQRHLADAVAIDLSSANVTVLAAAENPGYGLPMLVASRGEGQTIAQVYGVSPTLGAEATVDRFLASLAAPGIIHFAGHAVTDGVSPWRDHLVLAPSAAVPIGLLYQSDLELLRSRAWLVVLAACSTAHASGGDVPSVHSLAASILATGVPWVIGTLWEVDDRESASVFKHVHDLIRNGDSPAEAVRATQRFMSSQQVPPSVWASLVVVAG